jgi:hypothetical protein
MNDSCAPTQVIECNASSGDWRYADEKMYSLSASLIGRQGQAPQAIRHSSVDVAHGLALLFGLGTKALPSWDSKTKWNNLSGGLAITKMAGPSGQTISPHPSSREGHHSTGGWISISSYRI